MSRDPEVVALENALPFALAEADDAGSEADDWTGSEYVMRLALSAVAALHAAGYRVVAAESETELRALSEAASPGPWTLGRARMTVGFHHGPWYPQVWPAGGAPVADMNGRPGAPEKDAADAALIVAAVNHVRSLYAAAPTEEERQHD